MPLQHHDLVSQGQDFGLSICPTLEIHAKMSGGIRAVKRLSPEKPTPKSSIISMSMEFSGTTNLGTLGIALLAGLN
jgi:hypothetical protein